MSRDPTETLHASAVAWQGRAVLILGRAGAGKSSLALQLMAFGCDLVSDDRTIVTARGEDIWAAPPDAIAGRIEARGLGILPADHVPHARLILAVDLDSRETGRLPSRRVRDILGRAIPLVLGPAGPHLAASVLQFLKAGSDVRP
ncbi:MAG: HPr kinase/phosphatase C-terminal domain-containing protein [Rhodobacteraceae bacterium]|nr:HPr kinase/phosphatase C-terminal domain-containing protein [Paracoccaceae bacterium]